MYCMVYVSVECIGLFINIMSLTALVADIQLLLLGWIGLLLDDDTINSNTNNVTSSSGFIEIGNIHVHVY